MFESPTEQRAWTVVVADDDPDARALIAAALRASRRLRVIEASDGIELVARVQDFPRPPDLVVTDIQMPNEDGISATRRIRELLPTLPIMVVSWLANRSDASEAALRAGATRVVDKSLPAAELRRLALSLVKVTPVTEASAP